jgi:phenylalanyl-tRNA synthetase beta chain
LPVVRTSLTRLGRMVGADKKRILERLPYIGLDIESVEGDTVRVEYSPNRPDFGTDFGISRSIRGLLGKEVGLPRYAVHDSGITVSVDKKLAGIRPYIACAEARSLRLSDEDIRQLISLQEDLHNGLGRHRKVVAIGLHDLDAVEGPLSYKAAPPSLKFVPLDGRRPLSLSEILKETAEGKAYGGSLEGNLFPVISDKVGTVLSFPPVINGDATRVSSKTKNLFVDVTGTNAKTCDNVLAVIATTLAEAGARLGTVKIAYQSEKKTTPDLKPVVLPLDLEMIRSVLGLDLKRASVVKCLRRSRMDVKGERVLGPSYRFDLLHPVDVAEEVALGYGIDLLSPVYPPSNRPGFFDPFEEFLDSVSTVMAGSGMIELMTYELVDEKMLYSNFERSVSVKIAVQNPRSLEHSVLRDSLLPPLMAALSGNVKADYPQRVFEIGRVYHRERGSVGESWHLGCLVAHSQSSYTEAKMYLESLTRVLVGREVIAKEGRHWGMAPGRSALVSVGGRELGFVGEVRPESVDAFGLRVPVAGFEIDLGILKESLK